MIVDYLFLILDIPDACITDCDKHSYYLLEIPGQFRGA